MTSIAARTMWLRFVPRVMPRIVPRAYGSQYGEPRLGDVRDSLADIEKAKRLLGYHGAIHLREGLEASIDWYRSNLF